MPPKKKNNVEKEPELFNWYEHKSFKKAMQKEEPYPYENTMIKINSRLLCCGMTGSGKTQALLHYIRLMPDTFARIIVFYKQSETAYDVLGDNLKKGAIEFHSSLSELPTLKKMREDAEPEDRYLLVFDDYMMELAKGKYANVSDYFIYGRKQNITLFCLTQDYFTIPKPLRNQMTYLLLFQMAQQRDIKLIVSEFDTKEKIVEGLYHDAISQELGFLKINTTRCPKNEKFSKGFTNFYIIDDEKK